MRLTLLLMSLAAHAILIDPINIVVSSKLILPTTTIHSSSLQLGNKRHSTFLHPENTKKKATATILTSSPIHDTITTTTTNHKYDKLLSLRGGACDSDAVMYLKLFPSITLQALLLFLILLAPSSSLLTPLQNPQLYNLPVIQYIACFLVIFSSSLVGSLVDGTLSAATKQVLDPNVTPGEEGWYAGLNRPKWEPPGYVFPIMWLIVSKPTQFIAVSRLFRLVKNWGEDEKKLQWSVSLFIYCLHLSLGDTWNKVFFGYQCIGRGVTVITIFWSVLLLSAGLFYKLEEKAGLFMVPTCLWVSVAMALNWNIYLNNKGE